MSKTTNLRMTVFASLFAALTAAGAFIITLQFFFILLAGLLLGSKWGVASIAIYLFAGACGLPIFAGGTGGIAHFAGPTGGYLIGFLGTGYITGLISERTKNSMIWDVIAMICGLVITYAVGLVWLKYTTSLSFSKTFAVGMYPFIPGAVLKIAAAVPVAKSLRPLVKRV